MNRPVIAFAVAAIAVAGVATAGCASTGASGAAGQAGPATAGPAAGGSATLGASARVQSAVLAPAPAGWGSQPPRSVTPGAGGHRRAAVCPGLSAAQRAARPGPALTARVLAEYGVAARFRARYRIDLLVPADLDGTPVLGNLWPQPRHAFAAKNRLERRLHALVCAGRLGLARAQRAVRLDWPRAYRRFVEARTAPKPEAPPTAAPPPPAPAPPPPAPPTHAPPPPAPAGCHPLTDGGNCYEPGEYCRDSDHDVTGVAGDGETIQCLDNDGWRWEPV